MSHTTLLEDIKAELENVDAATLRSILEICRRTGKFPFVFVNEKCITIEENASSWHTTRKAGDYSETQWHLSQIFEYVDKLVRIELPSKSSETRTLETSIYCVLDWRLSPFVDVNPNRIALIGRDLLLALKPKVLLDFEKRQTEIGASVESSPTRKKSNGRKKHMLHSRQRRKNRK